MKLPPLMEALLAGLRCDPPDALLDERDETKAEVERLLREVEGRGEICTP
jgi:hypothetical protein